MGQDVIAGDLLVRGSLAVQGGFSIPAGAIGNSQVAAAAGIAATKLQHIHRRGYAQESATAAAAEARVVHVVVGATCTINKVSAGAVVAAIGADTATVDVKKNGTTILSAAISLTSAQSARQLVDGTITVPGGVVGDVFEVVVTASHSSGTLAKGIFASLDITEDAV